MNSPIAIAPHPHTTSCFAGGTTTIPIGLFQSCSTVNIFALTGEDMASPD